MIKVLLWDIDGTLLNFLKAEEAGIRSCFAKFNLGECTDEMLKAYSNINVTYWQRLERGEMTKPEILTGRFMEFFTKYDIGEKRDMDGNTERNTDISAESKTDSCGENGSKSDADIRALAEKFNAEYQVRLGDTICFEDNALQMLKEIQKRGNVIQCAVTNGTKLAQDRKLDKSGLREIFDYVFISEEVGYEKPDRRFFDAVMAALNGKQKDAAKDGTPETCEAEDGAENACAATDVKYSNNDIMIVGDSLTSDILLGVNAGIKTCWFNPAGKKNDKDYAPDYEISDLKEVIGLLDI